MLRPINTSCVLDYVTDATNEKPLWTQDLWQQIVIVPEKPPMNFANGAQCADKPVNGRSVGDHAEGLAARANLHLPPARREVIRRVPPERSKPEPRSRKLEAGTRTSGLRSNPEAEPGTRNPELEMLPRASAAMKVNLQANKPN